MNPEEYSKFLIENGLIPVLSKIILDNTSESSSEMVW